MKKFFIPVVVLIVFVVGVLGALYWWSENSKAVSGDDSSVRFVIPKGRSATQTGEKLAGAGLIKNPLAFKIYVQVTGQAKSILAGEYSLSPNLTLIEVVNTLTGGPEELWVTIPEGLRREEIVEIFIESLGMSASQSVIFRQEFLTESKSLEGSLFPDTYLFPPDAKASAVVGKMKAVFDDKVQSLRNDIDSSGYTEAQVVTLASIIERETKTDEERPVVAGILLKRLGSGVALQVDASVQYALANENCKLKIENCDNWWPVILREDLEINSPYNVYKFTGLPPAPIANPGFSSLSAAAKPSDSEYWYYIHDPDGNIHYAKDLAEHNANVRTYLGK